MHFVEKNMNLWNRKWKIPKSQFQRDEPCVSAHIRITNKSKTVMSSRKKKEDIFLYHLFSPKEFFLTFLFYPSVKCIKYTFRTIILLRIKKHHFMHFVVCFKIVESFQCILNSLWSLLAIRIMLCSQAISFQILLYAFFAQFS